MKNSNKFVLIVKILLYFIGSPMVLIYWLTGITSVGFIGYILLSIPPLISLISIVLALKK